MQLMRRFSAPIAATALLISTFAVTSPAQAFTDKNCADFDSQKAAQVFFLKNGGPQSDPHGLDSDGDGVACESNPAPTYYGTSLPDDGSGETTQPKVTVLKQRARVVKVTDGDTIKVRLASGLRRDVRLIGIDTPEVYGGSECGGPQASRSLKRLLPLGTRVTLVSDPTQDRADRYGRLLRYVVKNGKDVNRAQVIRGWARVYVYDNNPFNRTAGYRKAQRLAKAAPRGVWRACR